MSGNLRTYKKASKGNAPGVLKPQTVLMDLHTLIDEIAHKMSYEKTVEMAEMAKQITEKEEETYFKLISKLMGTQNKPTTDPEEGVRMKAFERVRWYALRLSTRNRKQRMRGPSFRNIKWLSGESTELGRIPLKSYLRQLNPKSFIKQHTEYKIYRTTTDRAYSQKYRIHIHPGLNDGISAFNDLDNSMFDSKEQERKVNAANNYRGVSNEEARPIFRPVMEYFAVQRIPRRINQELAKRGYHVTRFA